MELALDEVAQEAQKMAGKISISGAQPKLSVVRKSALLVPVQTGGRFILKPQTQTFRNLPENENLCMTIADHAGIAVPPHGLVQLKDGSYAYVVRRFDRDANNARLRCEDFGQILGDNKYEGSVERIGRKLKETSEFPGLDAQLLFERVLLSFLLGNGDAHLKNYSMLEGNEGSMRLSPSYDLVCSKLVIPGEDDTALTIDGKKKNLSKASFRALASNLQIPERVRDEIFEKFAALEDDAVVLIHDSHLPAVDRDKMEQIVRHRFGRLFKGRGVSP